MKTRRAVLTAPRKIEIREIDLNPPAAGQLLVKIAACGLCNWEQNHWKGLLGQCPQSLGHEWGGTVVEIGTGVKGFAAGDKVSGLPDSLTGFSDYILTGAATCLKLAAHVDPAQVPGEALKCIITVLRGTAPEAGDIGVVLGCGPMGLWCIQGIGNTLPAALIAMDVSPLKLDLAKQFGATHTINPRQEDTAARIREISGGHMADFVIEGTGVPETLNAAVTCLKKGRGRLAIMSSHERVSEGFDWRPVQDKGLMIMSTHPRYSTNEFDDFRRAIMLVNKGTFHMDGIISHRFPLERVQEAFETCEHKPVDYIKGVVIP
jgi:threonine dehydrogenase-like Zn-dependent dehydrogenase